MRLPHRLGAMLVTGLVAASAAAEDPAPQRVLVPVFASEPIPGVNGSSWATELWLSNRGQTSVAAYGVAWECMIPECGFAPAPVEPGRTFQPRLLGDEGGLRGALLYLGPENAGDLDLALRFRDLSRQGSTWGTELPVPRESTFHDSAFSLIDVPVDAGFRQTLRIYEIDGTPRTANVRVRTFRLDPSRSEPTGGADELLGEAELPLRFADVLGGVPPDHPGYAEVADLSALAPLGDAERLRLEIEPATPGLKLWAFVTVIHNETQHATVISPQ
jgi:hypothetical protein